MTALRNGRHTLRQAVMIALALGLAGLALGPAAALAAEELRIALVVPLSGRWARQGQLVKMGAEMAIEEVNAQGGVRALGGARIVLREADAGDTVEKAVSAAQRVLGRDRISAGIGAWLSSFTLGVTEVAERLQVPWFTLSYADSITERGFRYTFQTSPVAGLQAAQALDLFLALARGQGSEVKRAAIVGDNTAASVFFFKPLREKLLRDKGVELVVDEIWTPPLADATPVVQKLRATRPDLMLFSATALPDSIQVLQKMKEFGVRLPIMGNGVWLLMPETVRAVGRELIEGVMSSVGAHPLKGQEALVERFKQRTGEPFMVQDALMGYVHVWVIKEAAELARSADPRAIREAVTRLDLTAGPAAAALVPGRIRYDERGRRAGATTIIVQWQGGEPFTVAPAEFATRKPLWPHGR